jgi:hypothetical protein
VQFAIAAHFFALHSMLPQRNMRQIGGFFCVELSRRDQLQVAVRATADGRFTLQIFTLSGWVRHSRPTAGIIRRPTMPLWRTIHCRKRGVLGAPKISMRTTTKTNRLPVGPKLKWSLELAPARLVDVLLVVLLAVTGNGILASLAWFLVGLVIRP